MKKHMKNKFIFCSGICLLLFVSCKNQNQTNAKVVNDSSSNVQPATLQVPETYNEDQQTDTVSKGIETTLDDILRMEKLNFSKIEQQDTESYSFVETYKIHSTSIQKIHKLLVNDNFSFGEDAFLLKEIPEKKVMMSNLNPSVSVIPLYDQNILTKLSYEYGYDGGVTYVDFEQTENAVKITVTYSAD